MAQVDRNAPNFQVWRRLEGLPERYEDLMAAAEADFEARKAAPKVDRWLEGSRFMEAVYGGRLELHYPLGSVKDPERAREADRLELRYARAARETRCTYPGCLGPADGSECRHPGEEEDL